MTTRAAYAYSVFVAGLIYASIAWFAFQWRNPTSNEMSFYRDFWSVMRFEKCEMYQ